MLNLQNETIIAQCTPIGAGAIAMLRISGNNAIEIVEKFSQLINKNIKLSTASSHTINLGWIIDSNKNKIDQVLFLLMKAPNSFTGENTVEITCHNNQLIVEKIIALAIEFGARIATHGEFSKRAVLNSKIDLIQAEAINDLINANSELACKNSLNQLEGNLSFFIKQIEQKLIEMLALSEASFEFLDEENLEFGAQIKKNCLELTSEVKSCITNFDQQKYIREGFKIALIGKTNSGKSSLFNALLNQEKAIVTNIAGTTRDSIEAAITINSFNCTFIDTAGLRNSKNIIEQIGIDKSFKAAALADIILLVFDNKTKFSTLDLENYKKIITNYENKIILIRNKIDLKPKQKNLAFTKLIELEISAKEKKNLDLLKTQIGKKIVELMKDFKSPYLINQRQYNLLLNFQKELLFINKLFSKKQLDYEIASFHLKKSLEFLSEISGSTITNLSMNKIFEKFCIGK